MSARVRIDTDVAFGTGGDRELRCDVYSPPEPVEGAAAVVLVHGGAWRSGDRTQLRGYGILLGRMGYVCIAPEYRLTPEAAWPAQIHDVKAAVRWVRSHADQLGVDPGRIAVQGNSAGAHLALLVAATPGIEEFEGDGGSPGIDTSVGAVMAIYPPTRFATRPGVRGAVPLAALTEAGDDTIALAASPLSHVGPDHPPTLLIHGTADATVPWQASLVLHEALMAAGVPVDLHLVADQPHAFDAGPEFGRQCAAEMGLFLSRFLDRSGILGA